MLDMIRLKEILAAYKEDLVSKWWLAEKYKWEAVKCFRQNWDVNAPDFADMLTRALAKTGNLLASMNNFPAKMIMGFAGVAPEEVRAMYITLFDESRDAVMRILEFKERSSVLLEKYGNGAGQHYQYENAVSTYLWLRYPEKYYIYKYNEVKAAAEELGSNYRFKKGAYADNLRNFFSFYDELRAELKNEVGLVSLLKSRLTDSCYEDTELCTLTMDVGFYISRTVSTQRADDEPIEDDQPQARFAKYEKSDFLAEVYMTESRYDTLIAVLKNKKNIILQGAPGVGKTFAAKRLAYSVMGEKDESRIEFVQFHQNYSYEDLMMGYKPVKDGFELKQGIFYRFCQRAAKQPDRDFFFIIDEINRGNMSKIFGELLMLIEKEYRGTEATLAYNGLSFSVPQNLYIIGMMNTADRSLAMIDYALRRRFSFFDIEPAFESEGFIKYQQSLDNETLNELVSKVRELNREIALDRALGKGFCIGHSYFCGQSACSEEWLRAIVDYDILPMLKEYWFDDANKLQRWENILRGVFQ